MPRGDGTGPAGMGPMTGRGAGYCAGFGVPGYMNPVPGGGMGMARGRGGGFGGGRGWRNWYRATGMPGWMRAAQGLPAWGQPGYAAPPPPQAQMPGAYAAPQAGPSQEQELEMLRAQAEQMQSALENVQQRIQELEQSDSEEGQSKDNSS